MNCGGDACIDQGPGVELTLPTLIDSCIYCKAYFSRLVLRVGIVSRELFID